MRSRPLAALAVVLAGCAKPAPPAKKAAPPDSEPVYKFVGARNLAAPSAPVAPARPGAPPFLGTNLLAPAPDPNAPVPAFDAPDAIPASLPAFVGSAVTEPDGRAPQTADKLVLLALLRARRFADLERCFDDYQTAFELDARKEYWPFDALESFATGDAGVGALVNEWAAASPRSWAALAARGAHRHALAFLVRGGGYADTVPKEAWPEFRRQEEGAAADLRDAIRRRPRFIAASYTLLHVLRGDPGARATLDAAVRECPSCYLPRAAYLAGLWPEWGGSYEKMDAFIRETLAANPAPRLRLLKGTVPFARAMRARDAGRLDEAAALLEEALAAGDHWGVLLLRAEIRTKRAQAAAALPDLDRAFELRPQVAALADYRGVVRVHLGLLEGAVEDFALAHKLDPARTRPEEYARVADVFVRRSNQARAGGAGGRADELLDLANRLKVAAGAPGGPTPRPDAPTPAPTAVAYAEAAGAVRDQIASLPDDYDAYRRLGMQLLNTRRSSDLLELWNAWIARHPGDARGYRRRADAWSQLRSIDQRDSDLAYACQLGDADACRRQETNAKIRAAAPEAVR